MSSIESVVIAAAGVGRRIGRGIPKCLIEVCGKPIFEYQLELFKDIKEIRVVVGFEDEQVIRRMKSIRKDIVFVRNPQFQTTSTLQSFFLGCQGLSKKTILVDGDMIISRDSFSKFLKECRKGKELIGVSADISEEPIYANVLNGELIEFSKETNTGIEWANLAYLDPKKLEYNNTHLYVQIAKFLPMNFFEIERLEIDTEEDFKFAEKRIRGKKFIF